MTNPPDIVDEIAVRMDLVNACALAGGVDAWAANHKISPQLVSDVIHGRRSPYSVLLRYIGYSRVTRYRKSVPTRSEAA